MLQIKWSTFSLDNTFFFLELRVIFSLIGGDNSEFYLTICRNMNSKLMSQEEQITEYTERITAVEEELKKVSVFQIHSTSAFLCSSLANFHFWVFVWCHNNEWCIW